MAAEWSRELSVKVHAGHCRVASLGYRVGAPVGYIPYSTIEVHALAGVYMFVPKSRRSGMHPRTVPNRLRSHGAIHECEEHGWAKDGGRHLGTSRVSSTVARDPCATSRR